MDNTELKDATTTQDITAIRNRLKTLPTEILIRNGHGRLTRYRLGPEPVQQQFFDLHPNPE